MKPTIMLFAAAASLTLAGCYSPQRAEEHAADMAAAHCAEQGKDFVQTGGSAVATPAATAATAKGQCVGPNDVPPPAPPPGG